MDAISFYRASLRSAGQYRYRPNHSCAVLLNLVPTITEEYEKLGSYALCGLPESLYATRFVKEGQIDSDYPIVVGGRNFGCGSSREHAPIAMGFRWLQGSARRKFSRVFFAIASLRVNCIPAKRNNGSVTF